MRSMLVCLLALVAKTSAIIVGDSIPTSISSNDCANCLTSKQGLIATSTTAFTSQFFHEGTMPLTWTLGIRSNPLAGGPSKDEIVVTRDFYFGYPPGDNSSFSINPTFRSCSILVHGATVINGTSNNLPETKIDWGRELPSDCVQKLVMRVDDAAEQTTVSNDQNLSAFCKKVGTDLANATNLCPGYDVNLLHWKAFTNDPSQPGNCSLQSGGSYNVRWVDSDQITGPSSGDIAVKGVTQGTTPIITVVFPPPNVDALGPETHYLTLRAQTNLLPQVDHSSARRGRPADFVMFCWVVGIIFSILEFSTV